MRKSRFTEAQIIMGKPMSKATARANAAKSSITPSIQVPQSIENRTFLPSP